jgi:hypothetical protein
MRCADMSAAATTSTAAMSALRFCRHWRRGCKRGRQCGDHDNSRLPELHRELPIFADVVS